MNGGSVVATDQDASSSSHYQRVKLVDGTLDSFEPTGILTSPLYVNVVNSSATISVLNTSATISILNTSATISVLNTSATISVLNTGGSVNVLNTINTVSVLNTGGTISVLNTGGSINVLNTATTISVLNTGGTISVLNTSATISVLNTGGTISVLNTGGSINVLNTRTSVSVSGGVTLLSSIPLVVKKDSPNYSPTWIYSALSSAVNVAVWTPASGKKFNMTDITLNVKTAGKVTVSEGVTGSTIMIVELAANGGWSSNLQTPYVATATNTPLAVVSTAAGTVSYVCISGYEV